MVRQTKRASSQKSESRPKVLVIVGPTASGKSALGVVLARKFGGEIISADSRQVYRGLDIGTGKITKGEMHDIPHYLLDIASPKKKFTAHDFTQKGLTAFQKIGARGALPIIVGGTGFYIDALLGRVTPADTPPNQKVRERLGKRSAAELYAQLQKVDPERAARMDTPSERNNKHRLIRALEIASAKVRPLRAAKGVPSYDVLWIGIKPVHAELERKIKTRLTARIKHGMVAEAKRRHAAGLSYKRMEELGLEYRALARLLQKKLDRKQFEEELYREIRRYAKRQITYWKRNTDIRWFDPADIKKIEQYAARWFALRD